MEEKNPPNHRKRKNPDSSQPQQPQQPQQQSIICENNQVICTGDIFPQLQLASALKIMEERGQATADSLGIRPYPVYLYISKEFQGSSEQLIESMGLAISIIICDPRMEPGRHSYSH